VPRHKLDLAAAAVDRNVDALPVAVMLTHSTLSARMNLPAERMKYNF
jgi:hypothetical protein